MDEENNEDIYESDLPTDLEQKLECIQRYH